MTKIMSYSARLFILSSLLCIACQPADDPEVPANLADTDSCNDTDTDLESFVGPIMDALDMVASFEAACPGVVLPTISGWSAEDWYAHCGSCVPSDTVFGGFYLCAWGHVSKHEELCSKAAHIDETCVTMFTSPCDFTL